MSHLSSRHSFLCVLTETAQVFPQCVAGAHRGAFQPRDQHHGVELCCCHLQRWRHGGVFLCRSVGHQIWQVRTFRIDAAMTDNRSCDQDYGDNLNIAILLSFISFGLFEIWKIMISYLFLN